MVDTTKKDDPHGDRDALLEFKFPSGSVWEGDGKLVRRGDRVVLLIRRVSDDPDELESWYEHPSDNAGEVAALVYGAILGRAVDNPSNCDRDWAHLVVEFRNVSRDPQSSFRAGWHRGFHAAKLIAREMHEGEK